jgi:carbonic anhydrase
VFKYLAYCIEGDKAEEDLDTSWTSRLFSSYFLMTRQAKEFYNGHTFEVEGLGAPTMVLDGITYTLAQFHTHTPSEHKVAGRHYDMEMHFVHTATVDGVLKRAVVGAFYEKGDSSPRFIKQLMRDALPKATGEPQVLAPGVDFRVCSSSPSPHVPLPAPAPAHPVKPQEC